MEVIVIAFAFILEDFAELFVEYFVVEKFITYYDYETSAQSFAAGISSVTLNLIALVSFLGFVMNFSFNHKVISRHFPQDLFVHFIDVLVSCENKNKLV